MRSPRTVQQMHPLFISKISSSASMTSLGPVQTIGAQIVDAILRTDYDAPVEGLKAIDPHTLQVTLTAPSNEAQGEAIEYAPDGSALYRIGPGPANPAP